MHLLDKMILVLNAQYFFSCMNIKPNKFDLVISAVRLKDVR